MLYIFASWQFGIFSYAKNTRLLNFLQIISNDHFLGATSSKGVGVQRPNAICGNTAGTYK